MSTRVRLGADAPGERRDPGGRRHAAGVDYKRERAREEVLVMTRLATVCFGGLSDFSQLYVNAILILGQQMRFALAYN